jgi:oligoendopeptidase F
MLSSGGTKSHNDLLNPFNLSAYEDTFWDKAITMITSLMDELEELKK